MLRRGLLLVLISLFLAGCEDNRTPERKQADYEHAEAIQAEKDYFRNLQIAKVCPADYSGYRVYIYRGPSDARLWFSRYYNATAAPHFDPVASGVPLSEVC